MNFTFRDQPINLGADPFIPHVVKVLEAAPDGKLLAEDQVVALLSEVPQLLPLGPDKITEQLQRARALSGAGSIAAFSTIVRIPQLDGSHRNEIAFGNRNTVAKFRVAMNQHSRTQRAKLRALSQQKKDARKRSKAAAPAPAAPPKT